MRHISNTRPTPRLKAGSGVSLAMIDEAVSPLDCIAKGLAGLQALGMDTDEFGAFDPVALIAWPDLGPWNVVLKDVAAPQARHRRMHACEYLIVFADGARDYCEVKGEADPDFNGWPLLSVANVALNLAERAYTLHPPLAA